MLRQPTHPRKQVGGPRMPRTTRPDCRAKIVASPEESDTLFVYEPICDVLARECSCLHTMFIAPDHSSKLHFLNGNGLAFEALAISSIAGLTRHFLSDRQRFHRSNLHQDFFCADVARMLGRFRIIASNLSRLFTTKTSRCIPVGIILARPPSTECHTFC